jgi:hypothetical protein
MSAAAPNELQNLAKVMNAPEGTYVHPDCVVGAVFNICDPAERRRALSYAAHLRSS